MTMRWLTLFLCSLAYAQQFEAASVKVSQLRSINGAPVRLLPPSGGPGSSAPTHYTWNGATLQGMLLRAYEVQGFQLSGPDWMSSDLYDLELVLPELTTREQFAAMWRNLLATRFGVRVRQEQREFPVDELVVDPRGHKLKDAVDPNAAPFRLEVPFDQAGRLTGSGILTRVNRGPEGTIATASASALPISGLLGLLSNQVGHPVIDKTGLAGKYDFTLEFTPANSPDIGVGLAAAIQQQLGLRFEKSKAMFDYIVVEQAERVPSAN